MAFLAIGVTLIGHSFWVRVTTRLSPSVTSILYYGNIPIAITLGVLLLGDPVTQVRREARTFGAGRCTSGELS